MLINAQYITHHTPNRELLFDHLSFTLQKGEKAAVVGNNGTGKTTLLRIIAGKETNYTGSLQVNGSRYYVPQHYGHFDSCTVAAALGIAPLFDALKAVGQGAADQYYYDLLEHNWDIEARCEEAFAKWNITGIRPDQPLAELSGGMKTRLFLSGIDIFNPDVVLLDEPTNHLDAQARAQLLHWMDTTNATVLLVSHDRQLLRRCEPIWELQLGGIRAYGGNYDFYETQKQTETAAIAHKLAHHEKALKEARLKQQQTLERKQHADAQARKKARSGGIPKILINGRKNAAEMSTAKLKQVHSDKVGELRADLEDVTAMAQVQRIMKGYFGSAVLPAGKVLAEAAGLNYAYAPGRELWLTPLAFTIRSGSRLTISGANGSGKTTLLNLLLGNLKPTAGALQRTAATTLLLDQDYSLIDRGKTVLEQALAFNASLLETALLHTRLANFLFPPATWHKPCAVLSGGEMLRLALCCMTLQSNTPDIIFLDEPVNNLDLSNIRMLGSILTGYRGTLIVISHDAGFLEDIGITGEIKL